MSASNVRPVCSFGDTGQSAAAARVGQEAALSTNRVRLWRPAGASCDPSSIELQQKRFQIRRFEQMGMNRMIGGGSRFAQDTTGAPGGP